MEKTSKELLKEFVNSQQFTSTTDIMNSMKELFSDVLQTVMEAELEEKLGYEKSERVSNACKENMSKNYRNGYSKKTVKTQLGEVDVKIPRDRNGDYSPQIIEKYNRNADGMEEKILALYSCGMSQRDISEQIKNLYDVEISDGLVSKIVEKITPKLQRGRTVPWTLFIPLFLWMRYTIRSRKIINILQKLRMSFLVFKWTGVRIFWAYGSAKMRARNFGYR